MQGKIAEGKYLTRDVERNQAALDADKSFSASERKVLQAGIDEKKD